MANGGIIGPVNDPVISDLTQTFTASGILICQTLDQLQGKQIIWL
jgi:hypothetical protein